MYFPILFVSFVVILTSVKAFNVTLDGYFNKVGSTLVAVCAAWLIGKLVKRYFFRSEVLARGKAVLITGCDTGFGNRAALELHLKGFTVLATCLDAKSPGAETLKNKSGGKIQIFQLDVTKEEDVCRCRTEVEKFLVESDTELWALDNNAGVFVNGDVEWGSVRNVEKVLDVNVLGVVRVTREFLPLIRKSGGRIVNMASVAGRFSVPGVSSYSMSKHTIVSFSDCLRRELYFTDVKVITIEPEVYCTEMASPTNTLPAIERIWDETPEAVKQNYDPCHYKCMRLVAKSSQLVGNKDISPVVNAVIDAVSQTHPEIRYRCCSWLTAPIWFLLELLPQQIPDFFICYLIETGMSLAKFLIKSNFFKDRFTSR